MKTTDVNTSRFSGFADLYDSARPHPPGKVVEIISGYRRGKSIETLADIGTGTGLSLFLWKNYAHQIIGIEPNDDMRAIAHKKFPKITILDGNSYSTGLEKESVDVVTCSQSFHWMEPASTIKEVDKILKADGIFAVYDCDWPVSWNWIAENAYCDLMEKARMIKGLQSDSLQDYVQYPKEKHLENIKTSKKFRFTKTIVFDDIQPCDSERFIDIALSQGSIQDLIKAKNTEILLAIEEFSKICKKNTAKKMRVCYTMQIGIK